MRALRSVTIAPIGMPARSLKFAIAFLARVTTGFCPLMRLQLLDRGVDDLRVRDGRAETHVDHDLLEPRNLHRVLVAELLGERRDDLLLVFLEQPRRDDFRVDVTTRPPRRRTRRLAALAAALAAVAFAPLSALGLLARGASVAALGFSPSPFGFFSSAMAHYSDTAGSSSPLLTAMRTFLPPSSALKRTRVPLPVFGSTGMTLQA